MLVHSLSGGRSNSVGVLPNLRSDIEQRDHHRNSADDLSEIGEVVEIHGFQLQPHGRLRSIAATWVEAVPELALVLRGIEVAARFRDQAGIVNLPQLVAADPNAISCSCIRAG